jgi:hypothetical protein
VGDEHEAGVGADALLLGGPDADAVLGEGTGDGVQHTGLVGDVEAEEVLGEVSSIARMVGAGERAERAVRALRRLTAASITSPSTADAVGLPPAPRP